MANKMVQEDKGGNAGSLRLLPWTNEGKACWLSPASEGSVISAMADVMEAEQVRDGREVLAHARRLMEGDPNELDLHVLKFIAVRLTECLSDVLRVAESRGIRLGVADPNPDDDVEELFEGEPKASE
ncbi:hypothetical protein ACIPWL_29455 [Streptomyces sp. NPDC090023]|uniref:hypothetical protein n=1 Tax=unclassified Streptomyces TaxID=2593676 RepID=UPI003812CFA0